MDNTQQTAHWYDENAEDYTRHVRDSNDSVWHHYYEKPAMYALLPDDMTGMKVLSLGCGSGEDCHEIAKRGAKVVGVDISEKLIEKAREAYPESEYHVKDMQKLDFENESFDIIYSSLAVAYLDDWTEMLRGVVRILKPGGVFQFSMGHPTATAMEEFDVTEKSKSKGLVRIKTNWQKIFHGDYFGKRELVALSTNMAGVVNFHKTIQTVCDLCIEAGLQIDRIVEPQPLPEMEKIDPGAYEKLSKFPDFIIYGFKKA